MTETMTTSVSVILSEANGSRAGIMEFSRETLRDPSALLKQHSFGELNLMVLKHTPLGEINLPFVASSANAPRCRRNRRLSRVGGMTLNSKQNNGYELKVIVFWY